MNLRMILKDLLSGHATVRRPRTIVVGECGEAVALAKTCVGLQLSQAIDSTMMPRHDCSSETRTRALRPRVVNQDGLAQCG